MRWLLLCLLLAGCAGDDSEYKTNAQGWRQLYAREGEFVTRENGQVIATVNSDILVGQNDYLRSLSDWTIPVPPIGSAQADPPGQRYWRAKPEHYQFDLHFARGWGDDSAPPQ